LNAETQNINVPGTLFYRRMGCFQRSSAMKDPSFDTTLRIRERLYDVAASLYWASESGANVDLRELCDAYDSSAPEPVTPDERRFLPAMITQIPLPWVATAWIMDSVPEAERAMDAAEARWARRAELTC